MISRWALILARASACRDRGVARCCAESNGARRDARRIGAGTGACIGSTDDSSPPSAPPKLADGVRAHQPQRRASTSTFTSQLMTVMPQARASRRVRGQPVFDLGDGCCEFQRQEFRRKPNERLARRKRYHRHQQKSSPREAMPIPCPTKRWRSRCPRRQAL